MNLVAIYIIRILALLTLSLFFICQVVAVLMVTFWWLLPNNVQGEFNMPSSAGMLLVIIYASAFNHFPTEGVKLFKTYTFRYRSVPIIVLSTSGFIIGFAFRAS